MHTIVIASQKGGSGKTSLAGHLAVEASRAGIGPVSLIDTDPQGNLAQWWNARIAAEPNFVKANGFTLGETLAEMDRAGFRLAVIDTPPAITQCISQAVALADLVIVPTRPSPHDLRAVGATMDIIECHGKPLIFVVNGANARARITAEAAVALSQHGTVAPVIVHQRIDFAASMVDGRSVGEIVPGSPSAREITGLWIFVQDRLSRLVRDTKLIPELWHADFAVRPPIAAGGEDLLVEDRASSPQIASATLRLDVGTGSVTEATTFKGLDHRRYIFGRRRSDQQTAS